MTTGLQPNIGMVTPSGASVAAIALAPGVEPELIVTEPGVGYRLSVLENGRD